MKKQVRVAVIIFSVFSISVVAMAPYLFYKPKPTENNTIVASNEKPDKFQVQEPSAAGIVNPVSQELSVEPQVNPAPRLKEAPPKSVPVSTGIHGEHTRPNQKFIPETKAPKTGYQSKPIENYQPMTALKIKPSQLDNRKAANLPEASAAPEKPSSWAITVLGTNSGVDAGVSYRLLRFTLFNETNLDLIVATQQAGLGVSKYISGNLGLGIMGTVSYASGNNNIGIYAKYSF